MFQGTVFGPPLWNLYYADARTAVNAKGFVETIFADDFNCWRLFRITRDQVEIAQAAAMVEFHEAQHELHVWGDATRVVFDTFKESFHLLHRRFWEGDNCKILGVLFDPALLMHAAACEVATEAGWRLQALLEVKRFFTTSALFLMYNAHVLSYIESSTPGLLHALPSVLNGIDRVQPSFQRELGFSAVEALELYRLAPLPCRREMFVMGALHKIILGIAPQQLAALFPVVGIVHEPRVARFRERQD